MSRLFPYLLMTIPALCWAGNFVVGRAMGSEIPPAAFTFWRWTVALAALAPLAGGALWRARSVALARWRWLGLLALAGVFTFQYAVYTGLHTTTAINGALIISTIPVFIPGLAYLIDGDRFGARQGAGVALSLAGVAVILLRGDLETALGLRLAPGDLWILLAAFAWSLYSVIVRRRPQALSPTAALLGQVVFGLVMLAPIYGFEHANGARLELTTGTVLAILYVGLFASVVAFLCWNEGVARLGAARGGQFIHLMPLFAAGLAVLFLGERLEPYHGAGFVLIGAGLLLASTGRKRN